MGSSLAFALVFWTGFALTAGLACAVAIGAWRVLDLGIEIWQQRDRS